MKKTFRFFTLAVSLLACLSAFGQEMNSLMFRAGVKSPEMANGQVTFRFVAPKARKVSVAASWLGYDASKLQMTQDDKGIWTVSAPLPSPELYTYNIVVDGVTMLDPSNVQVQRDGSRYMNAFLVPGDYADLYAECGKPGNVEHVWYYSAENNMTRRMYVYTPAGYDRNNKSVKYPVLYLLHGGGGDEDAWSTLGRTCQILDNLIAQGKAKPMIVVMPNGNPNQYAAQTLGIPVKSEVKKYASNFDNSSGLIGATALGNAPFDAEQHFPGMYSNPAKYNKFDVIYLACGEQDNRIDGMLDFKQKLTDKGYKGVVWEQYPGAHEWKVWRRNLSSFVQLIFK